MLCRPKHLVAELLVEVTVQLSEDTEDVIPPVLDATLIKQESFTVMNRRSITFTLLTSAEWKEYDDETEQVSCKFN